MHLISLTQIWTGRLAITMVRKFRFPPTFCFIQCICSYNKKFLSIYNSIFSLPDVLFLSEQLNFLLALNFPALISQNVLIYLIKEVLYDTSLCLILASVSLNGLIFLAICTTALVFLFQDINSLNGTYTTHDLLLKNCKINQFQLQMIFEISVV